MPSTPSSPHWHLFAPETAVRFKEAMTSANPALVIGWSNAGPILRFIAAAVPVLTGERRSVQAAGKFLKERFRAREGLDGGARATWEPSRPETDADGVGPVYRAAGRL